MTDVNNEDDLSVDATSSPIQTEVELIKTKAAALKTSTDSIGTPPVITVPGGNRIPALDTASLGVVVSSISNVLSNAVLEFVSVSTAPALATSPGNPGNYNISNNLLHFCIAKNTWIKIQLTSF